jgi:hypothetical protein
LIFVIWLIMTFLVMVFSLIMTVCEGTGHGP